jgi:hypothetical protein
MRSLRLKQQMAREDADLQLDGDGMENDAKEGISPVEEPENKTSAIEDMGDTHVAAPAQRLEQLSLDDTNTDGVGSSAMPSPQPAGKSHENADSTEYSGLPSGVPAPTPATVTDPGDGDHDAGEESSGAPSKEAPGMSKKDKRRVREAAKKAKVAEDALNDASVQVPYLCISLHILSIS